ncbi:MAG: hypothetical protein LBT40_06455 [Deltaproteobacteria bacterium]|nr:hypothetical protein [Deltaproteobacteria bacterium]
MKAQFGFRTGDLVKAAVHKGKNTGVFTGRVSARSSRKIRGIWSGRDKGRCILEELPSFAEG